MVDGPARQCGVMAHELLHMFDNCRAKFDYRNLEHVACTEVRTTLYICYLLLKHTDACIKYICILVFYCKHLPLLRA